MAAPAMSETRAEIEVDARTIADLLESLGDIPADRVRLRPSPGTATEADLLAVHGLQKRIYELVDGALVEKAMGYYESCVAMVLVQLLRNYLERDRLGIVGGEAGMLRLRSGLVRAPDVSFIARDRLPDGKTPREPIPGLAPDLAVEVLSRSNTPKEIRRKLGEYFDAGTRLAWIVDPEARTVRVHSSPEVSTLLDELMTVEGGDILPGFRLPIADWFARADRP